MLNWIVVGIGDIAIRRVIPAIQAEPRSRLHGVVTRDPAKAATLPTRVWSSLDEALADPSARRDAESDAQAVYIATPVFLHAPQTIQSFRAGRHVLCEKPLAMNLAEARLMLQVSQEAGKTFGVAYYRRFYPKVQRAKQLLEAGAIGKPVVAELTCHMWLDGSESERNWLIDPAMAGGGAVHHVSSRRASSGRGDPSRSSICANVRTTVSANRVARYGIVPPACEKMYLTFGVRANVLL